MNGVCPFGDQFCGGVTGDGPVQFVLDRFVKCLGDCRLGVIVGTALGVDVGNLLIESAFAGFDFADTFE